MSGITKRAARSFYVYQLCREIALKGDAQLMMVRDVNFHGHALVEGTMRELARLGQQPRVLVPKPTTRPDVKARKRR